MPADQRRPGTHSQTLEITLRQRERLDRLWRRYARQPLPLDLPEIIQEQLGVDVRVRYGARLLANPFVVAPGPVSATVDGAVKAIEAGWGGIVLNSVAGEDRHGRSTLDRMRVSRDWLRSVYGPSDRRKDRPMAAWHGRLDARRLPGYAAFVREVCEAAAGTKTAIIASFAAAVPGPDEPWMPDEWEHTARTLAESGVRTLEIDFPAYFRNSAIPVAPAEVCGWVQEATGFVKGAADVRVWARMASLEAHRDFWTLAARAAAKGGASGIVVVDRLEAQHPTPDMAGGGLWRGAIAVCAALNGVRTLRATAVCGAVYTGLEALQAVQSGASMVQVFDLLAGKVTSVYKRSFNKSEQILYKLLLDPQDGLVAGLVDIRNRQGFDSVAAVVSAARSQASGRSRSSGEQ